MPCCAWHPPRVPRWRRATARRFRDSHPGRLPRYGSGCGQRWRNPPDGASRDSPSEKLQTYRVNKCKSAENKVSIGECFLCAGERKHLTFLDFSFSPPSASEAEGYRFDSCRGYFKNRHIATVGKTACRKLCRK